MALRTPEKPSELNPAYDPSQDEFQNIIDQNFSPGDQKMMQQRAEDGAASDIQNNSNSTAEDLLNGESSQSSKNSPDDIQQSEQEGGWKDNTTPQNSQGNKGGLARLKSSKAKIGAIMAGVGMMVAVLGLLSTLITGMLGLNNFKENILAKVSQRVTDAMERRSARIMAKKTTKEFTNGCTIKIKCRYRGFSEREIKKFNRRAGQHGYQLAQTNEKNWLGRYKVELIKFDPANWEPSNPDKDYKNLNGATILQADELRNEMKKSQRLRKAVVSFHKSNVEYFAGRTAKSVWLRTKTFLGKRTIKEPKGATEEDRQKYRQRQVIREAVSGEQVSIENKGGSLEGTSGLEDEDRKKVEEAQKQTDQVNDAISERTDQLNDAKADYEKSLAEPLEGTEDSKKIYGDKVESIRNMGGGLAGMVNMAAWVQGFCTVKMLVAAANNARYISQALQLMRFGIMFGSVADRIKAGEKDADGNALANQVNVLMQKLNSKDSSGKTAFDSFGYNWASNGSVRIGKDEDIGKYQNGGQPPGLFGEVTQATVDKIPDTACKVAFSKWTVAVTIGLTLFPLARGAATVGKEAFELAAKEGIKKVLKDKIENASLKKFIKEQSESGAAGRVAASQGALYILFDLGIPPLISLISRSITNTVVTGDEFGRDVGNAAVAGFGAANTQVSKAQGMQPISTSEAIRYDKLAYQNQLRLAKEEGINQFDPTNRFSFANQLATTSLPVASQLSSINLTTIPSLLQNFSSIALNTVFRKANAITEDEAQYKFCIDKVYKEADVAADPFCNPQYGMDPAISDGKNFDPEEVVEQLHNKGLIDDDGAPQGDFQTFIEKCMNSNAPLGEADDDLCTKKDSQNNTLMRLYCQDSSVDTNMNDGEGASCAPDLQSSVQTQNTDSGGTGEAPSRVDLATLYDPSDNISCAPGSKDIGIVNDAYHAGNKFKARLCAIENVSETGDLSDIPGADGKLVVNSRVSAVVVRMVADAKSDGVSPITAAEGYRSMARQTQLKNCAPGCTGGNPVADPGTSNHQAGVAIDWNEPMNTWMRNNGEKYGYKWYGSGDPPHFSPDGR